MNSSHPVSAKVAAPEEVEDMFDSVSYEKVTQSEHTSFPVLLTTNWKPTWTISLAFVHSQGASLLLMLNATLGEEVFKKGVIEYLTKYNGSNTVKEDLWNSLSPVQPASCVNNCWILITPRSPYCHRCSSSRNRPLMWGRWWTPGLYRKVFRWSLWAEPTPKWK